jgi:hypothetical protein
VPGDREVARFPLVRPFAGILVGNVLNFLDSGSKAGGNLNWADKFRII